MRPLGLVKLVLQSVDLEAAEAVFCCLKCGPHWGRSSTMMHSSKPAWNWEVCLLGCSTCTLWQATGQGCVPMARLTDCQAAFQAS